MSIELFIINYSLGNVLGAVIPTLLLFCFPNLVLNAASRILSVLDC